MRLNNKGVTMIELIGAMAILAMLFGLAVPAITTVINDTRNKTYVEDALKLASNAEYSLRKDNRIPRPTATRCVLMSLVYLDNGVFDEGPYGGLYEKNMSFVVVKKEGGDDVYYIRLIERLKDGDYRGIDLKKSSDLTTESAYKRSVVNISGSNTYKINENTESFILEKIESKVSGCSSLTIYAPNSSD